MVTFTAAGSGGTGNYEYQFWILPPGGVWTAKTSYSSTSTWAWNTTGLVAGAYQIGVWVKSTGSGPPTGYDKFMILNFSLQ
jgi:hypothetical protein